MSNVPNGNLIQLMKERRSVRCFNGITVPREQVLAIIEAGVWAPTGCNNQELRFLIIDEEPRLAEIVEFKPFFRGVSTVILVFCDMSLPMSKKMYCDYRHERHLPYVDTGLAMANMVLYAKSIGVDSCIFNLSEYHFKKSKNRTVLGRLQRLIMRRIGLTGRMDNNLQYYLAENLGVPAHLRIMCGVALGYAGKYPDIYSAGHGGRPIMRRGVADYLVVLPSLLSTRGQRRPAQPDAVRRHIPGTC